MLQLLQSILPSLELKNCRKEKLWQFLYHLVVDSISAFRLRPKTHMRSAVLCRSLNNSVRYRFDWNGQHYFVSIGKTFIDIFVALTELQKKIITHIVPQKTRKILFSHEKATQNFVCTKKTTQILLARGLSIRQLPAPGCWNVTLLLLLLLLLQKKCEYHRTCCDYLVAAACQDCCTWNERKKTPTFLSAGPKYGLRFVKRLCTHVQVLWVLAMAKDEQQGCNVSHYWQQLLLSYVEL